MGQPEFDPANGNLTTQKRPLNSSSCFAEQVLFATTLDEKLQSPAAVTDERPGSPLLTPQTPGGPAELRFKPQGSGKEDFSSIHRLEREHERGRLLPLFANPAQAANSPLEEHILNKAEARRARAFGLLGYRRSTP